MMREKEKKWKGDRKKKGFTVVLGEEDEEGE